MIVRLYDKNPNTKQILHIVECLKNGGVIIYPTDTVYGIGCDLMNPKALERISRIKGRESAVNMSLICQDLSQLSNYCKPFDTSIYRVLKRALPGPYTFILEANNQVPKLFNEKRRNIGIRIPDNEIIRSIVEALQNPLVNTTVETNQLPEPEYATDPDLIHERYQKMVDIVIDGGMGSLEFSTVIDCSDGQISVIRQGKGNTDFIL